MSSIEFVQSSKSKTILVVDGYEYYKKRENKLTTAWNCAQYQTLSCRTSAITSGEQLISIRGNHNHDICLGKVGARKVSKKIKELSEVSTPAVSVASALLEVTHEYATQLTLPSKASLFKVSQRVRQKKDLIQFPDPASRNFDVPEEFNSFLVHDTGKEDHERIMVFGDNEMIKYLQSSQSWLADGTFKLSPKMFYQLYTVHIQGPGIAPACVYGFLPNKTESTYKRFLDILLSLLPNAAPDKVLIDFELAAMKAFEKALPNANISGCFFHLSQNFIRKIGELGLKNLYHSNPELSLALKLIPSLAFEKLKNVKSSFKLVVEDIQEVCEQLSLDSSEVERIDELCSYFQNTYIEKNLREPLFPPSIWNKREAASEGVARTTNAVEGWHFGIQAFFSGSHPSLWRTLENLKKDAATQKYLYLQSTAGTEFSRRKKYRELEAKVKNAIERHQDENTIAFLRAMASLSMSN